MKRHYNGCLIIDLSIWWGSSNTQLIDLVKWLKNPKRAICLEMTNSRSIGKWSWFWLKLLDTLSTLRGGVNSVYWFCYFSNVNNHQQLIQYYEEYVIIIIHIIISSSHKKHIKTQYTRFLRGNLSPGGKTMESF